MDKWRCRRATVRKRMNGRRWHQQRYYNVLPRYMYMVDCLIIHSHLMVRLPYNHVENNKCFDDGIRDHKNKNYRKCWLAFVIKRKKFSVVMKMPLIKHIERNIRWRDKDCNKQTMTPDCNFVCRRPKNRWTSQACDKERSDFCEKCFGAISKGMVYNCVL